MNKESLIDAIRTRNGCENIQVVHIHTIITAFMDTVKEQVENGDNVSLQGFGTFKSVTRKARIGRSPMCGEWSAPAKQVLKFVPARKLRKL